MRHEHPRGDNAAVKRWILRAVIVGTVVFVGLQLFPFGRIEQRPTTAEAPWPTEESRRLAINACYDCHSNEPTLEWFDRIAPGSWIVAEHVAEGRLELNFSEWDRYADEADDAADTLEDDEMPLRQYTLLHPEARLTDAERRTLIAALRQLEGADDDDRG